MSFPNNHIFTSPNSSISRSVRGKRAKLQMVDATSSPLPPSSSTPLPAATTPLIGCRQVLSALNGAYSTPLARARLPLQPRLLLAVCLTISANKKVGIWLNRFFLRFKKFIYQVVSATSPMSISFHICTK